MGLVLALSAVLASASACSDDGGASGTPGTFGAPTTAGPTAQPQPPAMQPPDAMNGAMMQPAAMPAAPGDGMPPAMMPADPPGDGASGAAAPMPMDGGDDMTMMMPAPSAGRLPPVDSVDGMGPFEVTIEQGQSPGGGWVARPTDLGADGLLHPIFVWGCGGGSQPSQYEDHLRMIASHGFVMEAHVSSGNASDHGEPLSWLLAENDDPSSVYYQKLDTAHIAAGGHSMGSIATFAFEGDTDLLTTSIHVAGGSFDGNGFMRIKTPTLMVGGVDDTLAGANTSRDFERVTMPAFYTNIEDTDHILAARAGLPPMIAWLRWHLGGEEERSQMFLADDCDFCGGKWNGMAKNW